MSPPEWRATTASIRLQLLIFLLLFALELCASCPISCSCKWKNGKQTVECINKDLLVIPDGMDSGTQVLEFCGNNLQTLHRDKFLKMDLINLQRIYLCRCRITTIDDRTFKGLTNLVELDLSGNLLESVPSESLRACPSLMRLILNSNPIKTLRKSAFNQLAFLNTLELSRCQIAKIEEGAFQGLYALEWLHLNGNRLASLASCSYFPDALKGVHLQDNPWECDCHIVELHAWLAAFTVPHSVEPTCRGPGRLRARPIKSVPLGELACLPEVSPTMFYLEIGEGKNVSLLCEVSAVPEADVTWTFHGQLLQNDSVVAPGVHLLYFVDEGRHEKKSELLIYNANTDDNGTFICNAENPAGLVQANFTIRIIVKHEHSMGANELPFEFVLITLSAAAISILLLLFVIILTIVKCQRNSRLRRKRNNSKVALSNSTKDNLLQENSVDDYSSSNDNYKESSSIKLVSVEEETRLYSPPHPDRVSSPPVTNLVVSPTRYHHLEQNPDLINGTESVGRFRECDTAFSTPLKRDVYVYVGAGPDVHLNPIGLMGEARPCYKTLPYNRPGKRSANAANPMGRFSREAEFLSHTTVLQPASYEHYTDVRYTADGYPVRTEPCCSTVNWPACVANSVGAQTQTEEMEGQQANAKMINKHLTGSVKVHETLTESLDEGYEGEGTENNANSCQNL